LGLEPLAERRQRLDLGFAHSVVHKRHHCPAISLQRLASVYETRDTLRLTVPYNISCSLARLPVARVSKAWNSLPLRIRRLKTIAFKANI
jgi:hypothetical protein